jgi:hypothetical protein
MDESQISDCLELFDLPDSFTEAQLKQAYRDLVQVWHPDKHAHHERLRMKAEEKMKEINQAYEALQSSLINGSFRFERIRGVHRSETDGNRPTEGHQRPPPSETRSGASSPQDSPRVEVARHEPKVLSGNTFWILTIGLILLVVIAAPRGRKSSSADTPEAAPPPSQSDLPPLFSIDGPPGGSNTMHSPIARAVDLKNGFRDHRFGMTLEEAKRQLKPDRVTTNQYNQLVTFFYGPGASNKLGDFPLDDVNAYFFRGKLFRIEVSFSSNAEQLFEALQRSYGASRPSDSLTKDASPARVECWFGEKVFCAIVAPKYSDSRTGWDGLVMYDQALNLEANQYAREEPLRAAQTLSEDGFGEFTFGMTLKEFGRRLGHSPKVTDAGVGQSEVVVSGSEHSKLGRYPISSWRASFFQNRLYKLELSFETNRKQIFEGFMGRFPTAIDSDSWTRDNDTLRAKQFTGERTIAVILAARSGSPQWDSIILYDRKLDQQKREFESDAPKRAAKEL